MLMYRDLLDVRNLFREDRIHVMPPINPLAYLIKTVYEIGIIIWCLIVGVRRMETIQEPVKEQKPIERNPALWIASLVLYSLAGLIAFAIRTRTPVISSV